MIPIAVGLALAAMVESAAAAQTPVRPSQATPRRDAQRVASTGTATIRGRVVAADTGRPLTLATITASAAALSEARAISTNSEGRYELRNLPAGRYTLSISHSGYLRLQYGQRRPLELGKPIDVPEAAIVDDIDFVLPRMSVISGRITDEQGEPMAGARIIAMLSKPYGDRRPWPPVGAGFGSTDDSGSFRLTGLSPGSYVVMSDTTTSIFTSSEVGVMKSEGYAPTYFPGVSNPAAARVVSLGIGEEAANTDFSLQPTRLATITGALQDSRGRPVPNQQIAIARQAPGLTPTGVAVSPLGGRTNEGGAFVVRNLTPGEVTLIAGAGPGSPEVAIATVNIDGADVTLPLTTSGGWSVAGRVVADVGPLPAAFRNRLSVAVFPLNALASIRIYGVGGGTDAGAVNEDGTFSVAGAFGAVRVGVIGLPDGWIQTDVLYEGRSIGGRPISARDGDVASGVQIVLSNRLATVSGQLADASGAPPVNGTVIVFADDGERWFQGTRFIRAVRADAKGRYEITGMPPAVYLAIAVDYVTQVMWSDPDYLESLRPHAIKFTLGPGESRSVPLTLVAP
jgi:hypothetical protein